MAVCPSGVIDIIEKKAVMIDYNGCLECGACQMNCNFGAIDLTIGTGCMAAIIREDILQTVPKGTGCGCGTDGSDCC